MCGGSSPVSEEEVEAAQNSKRINALIRIDEKRLAREVKMLLLGPGSSGKSTILKQMKIIHTPGGFSMNELEIYRQNIFENLCSTMKICFGLLAEWNIELENDSNADYEEMFDEYPILAVGAPFPENYLNVMKSLWSDSGIQTIVGRGNEVALPENMQYFYAELARLFSTNFIPNDQDVLRCRQKTTGIIETIFESNSLNYKLFDVGGQRSERKKWIHCFENVTAVLFLAAISSYDQVLVEDKDSNAMQEAIMLFDSICNSQWFLKTSIILFLNKVDIFASRILISPISRYFPDYTGSDTDFIATKEYFKSRFTKLNRSQSKEIYTNYTTAIDTNLVRVVMASVADIVITRNLQDIIL